MTDKNIVDEKDMNAHGAINDPASEAHVQPQSRAEDIFGSRHVAGGDHNEFKEHKGIEESGSPETAGKVGGGLDKLGLLNKKSDIKRAFRQTALVKDLRMFKEKEKKRRSLLIYGTIDMKTKLFEKSNIETKKKRKG